jgi:hypothetical protein
MTPTTLALQMPTKSKEESISSLQRTRSVFAQALRAAAFLARR